MKHLATMGMGLAALIALASAAPASALTTKECSAKYKEAKAAGTLGTMKWNDFRKAECGSASAPAAAPAAAATTAPTPVAKPPVVHAATPAAAPAQAGSPVFPRAVSAQYTSLKAGKAREKTCLDQYHANKANGGNAGLRWIQKGGGYYSQCNKALKS